MAKAMYIHGAGGTPAYAAVDDRILLASILGGDAFSVPIAGSGPIGKGHGGLTPDAMNVSVVTGQTISVSSGMVCVRGTQTNQHGTYLCRNDASVTLNVANRSATLSRRDLVIAEVRDAQFSGASNDWRLRIVQGTDAASPVDPTVPASSLVLARISIPPGSSTYTLSSTWIDNEVRAQARAVGGIRPAVTHTDVLNPEPYDFVLNKTTQNLMMYDGSQWIQVATNLSAPWTAFTPNWGTSVSSVSSSYGRYTRLGRTVTGVSGFTRGSGTSMSGNLYLDIAASGLPPVQDPGFPQARYLAGGRLFDVSASQDYSVTAEINYTTQRMENFGTLGNAVWGPTSPVTWATGDRFWMFWNYESSA